MLTLKQIYFACAFTFALLSTVIAQDSPRATTQSSSLTITAAASGERVRITAPSSVVQMHVEVYAASGEKLFDQEIRGGNVFDWHLQDGQAQRLAPGNYVCVVTAKSVSGRLTQKIGTVSVADKSASVQAADSPKLSVQQTQAIGPVEENSSWTIAAKDEPQTGTVIAHDGTDGQMIRGRGALTFRIGDFFSGIDQEQMRLTEAGNLGIGTSEPRAKLDVAGTIRAQRVLIAKPNNPASNLKAQVTDDVDSAQPLASGTGTQDRIAKWTDNAGTLGDSGITETAGGFVGIGTTTPGSKLVVSANSSTLPPASGVARFADADGGQTAVFADAFSNNAIFNVRRANGTAAAPSALQFNQLIGVIGASGYGASAYMGTRARVAFWASEMWTDSANGTYLTFNTTTNGAATPGGTERVRIDNAGNVGIGTTSPTARLSIRGAGDIFTSGAARFDLFNTTANTGFQEHVTDGGLWQLLRMDGALCMVVDPNGNVGIGTIAPGQKLDVNGNGRVTGNLNVGGHFRVEGTTGFPTSFGANGDFDIDTPGIVGGRFSVLENGNVGIGKPAPGSRLHVNVPSSTSPISAMSIDVQSFSTPGNAVASHFFRVTDIFSGGPSAFLIRGDGNVGIGTDAPNAKLQVQNGDVYVGTPGNGIILKSPNGAVCRRLTVDNAGNLASAPVTCP